MHRPKHKKKTSSKLIWLLLCVAAIFVLCIYGYFDNQLSHESRDTQATQIDSHRKKVIVVNDTDSTSNLNHEDDSSESSQASSSSSSSSVLNTKPFPNLKTASICACLLVAPNWLKTNQISFNQNGQSGSLKDTNGNMVQITQNNDGSITVTEFPHGKPGATRQIPLTEIYNDYYNTPQKQNEVNSFTSHVNQN